MTDAAAFAIGRIMIQTGHDLRDARERLGWSQVELGMALGMAGERATVRKRIDSMELGQKEISGPVGVAIEAFLTGFRPSHFNPDVD